MMTKHIILILILASLLTSCQCRELVGNLDRMQTEESRAAGNNALIVDDYDDAK
jgi:hypothetical protein